MSDKEELAKVYDMIYQKGFGDGFEAGVETKSQRHSEVYKDGWTAALKEMKSFITKDKQW